MKAKNFIDILVEKDLLFLTGVPCSFLKNFLSSLGSEKTQLQHIIAASEGEAVGIATGYHLATNKVPVIYLQNSGFGNAVNPLTSLMDKKVYSIPAILFLTWRGEPNTKDEPQHKKMGAIMLDLLKVLEIPYRFANKNLHETAKSIIELKKTAIKEQKPVALIFRDNLFEKQNLENSSNDSSLMKIEYILSKLLPKIGNHPIIATTGKISREIFELREMYKQSHKLDFLTVGSMGCASGIGFGIAIQTKNKVFVIDGDGAVLMKMGTLATIGYHANQAKLTHIIIDNSSHETTGGQPTASSILNWKQLLKSIGYKKVTIIKTEKQLMKLKFENKIFPFGVVIYSKPGARTNLGRPTSTPIHNKKEFMKFLSTQ